MMTAGVAIMTFNRPALLREALRSVQAQTRRPDEVFISDNSTHPDHGLVQEFPDLPIRYHFHDRRLPIDEHWIWCISQPRADLVAVLEDDNLFRRDHLEVLAGAMELHPSATLGGSVALAFEQQCCTFQRSIFAPLWKADLLTQEPRLIPRQVGIATYLFGVPFASSAVMYRRAALDRFEFFRSGLKIGHDRWMWAQIAVHGDIVFAPQTTMLYREHATQVVKMHARSIHREDSRDGTKLIIKLICDAGIALDQAVTVLTAELSEREKETLAYLVFRERCPETSRLLLPLIYPGKSFAMVNALAFKRFAKSRFEAFLRSPS